MGNLEERVAQWRLIAHDWQYTDEECVPVITEICDCLDKEFDAIVTDPDFCPDNISEYIDRIYKCTEHIKVYIGQGDSDVRQALFSNLENETEYTYDDFYDAWLKPVNQEMANVKDLVNQKLHSSTTKEEVEDFLSSIPGVIRPIDKEEETFEWVDGKLNNWINEKLSDFGADECWFKIDDSKLTLMSEPKGFDCFKLNLKSEGKLNVLSNIGIKGIHDIVSPRVITSCILSYINTKSDNRGFNLICQNLRKSD